MRTCKIGYLNGARACSMQLKIIMNSDHINLGDIAYEQIDGKYWFGQYGDFNVVLDKESGYVNVSKLCRDGGKNFSHWKENKFSKELIAAFSLDVPQVRIRTSQNDWLIIKIITQQHTEQDKLIIGSYAHPDLVPHIASWVSAPFARMVSKITNNFLFGQYKSLLMEKQMQLDEEQTRRQHAEEWASQEKAGREATTQILQITEQQNEIMKRELAYADEEVREKDKALEDKNVEVMEKDKALDDKNVEIARQSAELAVAGLNLQTTKNELGGAKG